MAARITYHLKGGDKKSGEVGAKVPDLPSPPATDAPGTPVPAFITKQLFVVVNRESRYVAVIRAEEVAAVTLTAADGSEKAFEAALAKATDIMSKAIAGDLEDEVARGVRLPDPVAKTAHVKLGNQDLAFGVAGPLVD